MYPEVNQTWIYFIWRAVFTIRLKTLLILSEKTTESAEYRRAQQEHISQNRKKQCHMIFRNHNIMLKGAQETFLIIINDENSSAAQYLCINVILFIFQDSQINIFILDIL